MKWFWPTGGRRRGLHELLCRHLRELREAGLTHVHLLPAYDYATVPERPEDQLDVEVSADITYQLLALSSIESPCMRASDSWHCFII